MDLHVERRLRGNCWQSVCLEGNLNNESNELSELNIVMVTPSLGCSSDIGSDVSEVPEDVETALFKELERVVEES